jgi:hypothetical protein
LLFPPAIHIAAHVFNFENLVEAYDGSELQHRLSIMEDIGNKTYINPVRNMNSVSTTLAETRLIPSIKSKFCLW